MLIVLKMLIKIITSRTLPFKAKKVIYVCSPLRGNIELNRMKAIEYSKHVSDLGFIPITPHAYFTTFIDDNNPDERVKGMDMAKQLLILCDELWIFGDIVSQGMAAEIELAKSLGIKVVKCVYKSALIAA